MKTGVFGGSFDPVHCGHVALARAALAQLGLDRVILVPTSRQPLKTSGPRARAEDRVAMLEIAFAGDPAFHLDDRELRRPGPSYTIDTLRELAALYPSDQLFLLVGSDAARDLPRWREAAAITGMATVAVVARAGTDVREVVAGIPGAVAVEIEPVEVSATDVRRAAAQGRPITDMVPAGVAEYIRDHSLYAGD